MYSGACLTTASPICRAGAAAPCAVDFVFARDLTAPDIAAGETALLARAAGRHSGRLLDRFSGILVCLFSLRHA
ncbi:MAG TPA: hypothetical protein VLI42_00215 [Chthoniobacterales bacterium]|nr:hypothetical protein [Chthoniobacterales bacterium]